MPELPEVESVVRSLARAKLRSPITQVWRSRFALRTGEAWRRELEHVESLAGMRPAKPIRRAKYVLWPFEPTSPRDDSNLRLLVHLGMSGRCEVVRDDAPLAPHTHLRLTFGDGREFRFVDPRRFGGLNVATPREQDERPPLCDLGPEPLARGFDGETLAERGGSSRRCLRDVLLDQRVVAGLGNIYVNEALFEAGLDPRVAARRLRPSAWERLAQAVVSVLERGVANGGTTLRDYRDADGNTGRNQNELFVYGRADEPCRRCGTPLVGFVLGGRSGARCPRCQQNPRTRWVG